MADFLLKQKANNWKKNFDVIKGNEARLDGEQLKAFNDINAWVARVGYTNKCSTADRDQLLALTATLHKYVDNNLQDEVYTAVNSFVSLMEWLTERQGRNSNTWYDFYDLVKDKVGAPQQPQPVAQPKTQPVSQPKVQPVSPGPNPITVQPKTQPTNRIVPTPTTIPTQPTQPQTPPTPERGKRRGEHFSFAALGQLVLAYGGLLLLGALPFLIGWGASYLFDTGHWFFGILAVIAAIASIGYAWYGWLAAAAVLVPLWLVTGTTWWWLGAIIFLVELGFIWSSCQVTDDD